MLDFFSSGACSSTGMWFIRYCDVGLVPETSQLMLLQDIFLISPKNCIGVKLLWMNVLNKNFHPRNQGLFGTYCYAVNFLFLLSSLIISCLFLFHSLVQKIWCGLKQTLSQRPRKHNFYHVHVFPVQSRIAMTLQKRDWLQ